MTENNSQSRDGVAMSGVTTGHNSPFNVVNKITHNILAMPGALADKKRVTRSPPMKVTIPSVIGLPPSGPPIFCSVASHV